MKNKWLKFAAVVIVLLAIVAGYRHEMGTRSFNGSHSKITAVSSVHRQALAKTQGRKSYRGVGYHIWLTDAKTKKVTKPENVWRKPNHSKQNRIGTTESLLKRPNKYTNLVQVDQQAVAKGKPTYDHITRQGKPIGWINDRAVHSTSTYVLPYVYTSQFWPSAADDACEEASLKTALSTQNKAMKVPLRQMVEQTPRSINPNDGYTKDPYHYRSHATIYPDALVRVAHKYGARAKNISGAGKSRFIHEVTHGHAVVFEGPYMLSKPGSDHDLVILGYKKGKFFIADPFARHHYSPRTRWASTKLLMKLYNSKSRHQRALVVE